MKRAIPLLIMLLLAAAGCQKKSADSGPANLSEAQKKFVETLRKEKLNVTVYERGKTLWIYLPMEEDLVDYHGAQRSETSRQKKQFIVSTFEGDKKDSNYRFMFDITDGVKTQKDPGYKSDATEAFVRNRTLLYGTINENFLDLPKDKAPEFIGVLIASIKKGIAYKTVFNLDDYTKYRSEVLPFEEYNMREISELYGDERLVGDKTGANMTFKAVEWPWFLIEQIKNRVNFKFTRSDFPPDGDIVIELAGIIANTFRYYGIDDFSQVVLKDIRDKKSYQFDPQQLASFHETAGMYTDRARYIKMRRMVPMQTEDATPGVEK